MAPPVGLLFIDAGVGNEFAVMLGQQALRHVVQLAVQAEAVAFFQPLHDACRQPVQQGVFLSGVFFSEAVQQAVDGLGGKSFLVELDLVGGEMADLPGEGFQRLLEEAVDCRDGEGGIVVEKGCETLFCALLQGGCVRQQPGHEIPVIIGLLRG